MGESGKQNFFTLMLTERKEKGFDFRMDERVYSEMEAMSKADHTIHPASLVDTGAAGGVQMPGPGGDQNESVPSEGCGDGQDDDRGSTRDSTFSSGSAGRSGKRKNVRQQTFKAIADVMDKHGKMMATTVDSASKRHCSVVMRSRHRCTADRRPSVECPHTLAVPLWQAIVTHYDAVSITWNNTCHVGNIRYQAPPSTADESRTDGTEHLTTDVHRHRGCLVHGRWASDRGTCFSNSALQTPNSVQDRSAVRRPPDMHALTGDGMCTSSMLQDDDAVGGRRAWNPVGNGATMTEARPTLGDGYEHTLACR
ncbi:hypothetical protein CBR_g38573 [Chara braunii]|uniref:Uncharacterized protein n=1 Tax=Chara braunii TaxID=69332 RepID=A0A388K0F9_CHABU|nr:hypothetical protein CBR_g38573 [Chara braunii]|eukprot:GBG63505.1 hypothetical protein CBR_g38573 [Chara braunii]